RTFKIFLTRDVTFIIGGASVFGACYYLLSPELNMRPHSWASYLVVLGLGHFVGFALQSLGNFIRLVNAGSLVKPGRFVLILYRRFNREKTWYAHSPVVDVRFPQ